MNVNKYFFIETTNEGLSPQDLGLAAACNNYYNPSGSQFVVLTSPKVLAGRLFLGQTVPSPSHSGSHGKEDCQPCSLSSVFLI